MTFEYEYVEGLRPGENQYSELYDLEDESIVEARYIPSKTDPGNPFVEALPSAWSFMEIAQYYNRAIIIPDEDELRAMNEYEREDNIDLSLDDFRLLLPFHAITEKQFHRALIRSYHRRKTIEDRDIDVRLHIKNREVTVHNRMIPRNMSEPVAGFTILGQSGCGKSTGTNMMLSHYPQTIIHQKDTWRRMYQIVYLLVSCSQNSNPSQLYENIGEAIDNAVGNFNPVYKQEFRRGTLGDKYGLLKKLVMQFSIGCLILDEIELIDIRSTKPGSLEAFLTLANETGIAIAIIGTMDAYEDLFMNTRTARRTGVSIIASRYCNNREQFHKIAGRLTMFQWSSKKTVYTSELLEALYEASHGVISDLIEIYKLIQKDQVRHLPAGRNTNGRSGHSKEKESVEITVDYIHKIAQTYYEILHRARMQNDDPTTDSASHMTYEEIARLNTAAEMTDQAQMEKRYEEVMSDSLYRKYVQLKEAVVIDIMAMKLQYRRKSIERAFGIVMTEQDIGISTEHAAALTLAYLNESKAKRKKKASQSSCEVDKAIVDLEALQKALKDNNADGQEGNVEWHR